MQAHKTVVAQFITQLKKCQKNKAEYFSDARNLINKGKNEEAFGLLKEGLEVFPDDPLMYSYYGSIYSKAGKKPVKGIKICRDAILKFNSQITAKNEFLKPIYYLNLGRAYLSANKKKEAIHAFNIGLKEDSTNANIISEIYKLGRRRKPIIPFLERGNPLNKYLGLFLNRTGLSRR
jgi:tetratricopeptide (TPR) repeat protein